MALGTFSKFYYGYEITSANNKFDFNEGASDLTATVDIGIYTPTDLAAELKLQLDAIGSKTYTVTFNRSARTFTIAADSGTYSILINSGTNSTIGIYDMLGFTGSVDLTGVITYTSDSASGSEYKPQFWLQDYTAPTNWLEKNEASVNVSATGLVEVISFGDTQYLEFNMMFITDLAMDGRVIKNNPNGVANANTFMQFAIKRGEIEFMPDENTVATFYKVILDSTPDNAKATGYKLKEETGRNLPGIYTTGKLKWRVTT
jgi:hypothetical protein